MNIDRKGEGRNDLKILKGTPLRRLAIDVHTTIKEEYPVNV